MSLKVVEDVMASPLQKAGPEAKHPLRVATRCEASWQEHL
jgi:hypothetical protein